MRPLGDGASKNQRSLWSKEPEMSHNRGDHLRLNAKPKEAFSQPETKKVISEYECAQNALHANFRRLGSERLSRESAAKDSAKQKGK